MNALRLRQVGQIAEADLSFGDLTVLVGPQASGKSITLRWLKLLVDTGQTQERLFGQIPEVLEAMWIGVAQGKIEAAKRRIDGLEQRHPFDDRYAPVANIDWETCTKVLSERDRMQVMGSGW